MNVTFLNLKQIFLDLRLHAHRDFHVLYHPQGAEQPRKLARAQARSTGMEDKDIVLHLFQGFTAGNRKRSPYPQQRSFLLLAPVDDEL